MDGRPDAALAAFRRAVELDCDNQAAQSNLAEAEVLESLGRGSSSEVGAPP
jgi:cytochrome c-type biogenesis protein CcmH/NrfG